MFVSVIGTLQAMGALAASITVGATGTGALTAG